MPEITAGHYLLEALSKMGPTKAGPMGAEIPVEWPDIVAFSIATRRITEPWEFELIYQMGVAYCEGKSDGRDVFSKPPIER